MSKDRKRRQQFSPEARFGADILADGFTVVPNIILRNRARLGLTPDLFCTLLDVMSFQWDHRLPFPSLATLADIDGSQARGIRKRLARMEELTVTVDSGAELPMLRREEFFDPDRNGGRGSNGYDMEGLLECIRLLQRDHPDQLWGIRKTKDEDE